MLFRRRRRRLVRKHIKFTDRPPPPPPSNAPPFVFGPPRQRNPAICNYHNSAIQGVPNELCVRRETPYEHRSRKNLFLFRSQNPNQNKRLSLHVLYVLKVYIDFPPPPRCVMVEILFLKPNHNRRFT